MRIRSLLITAVLVYLIAAVPASQAQTQVPAQPTVTLQAELLKTIEASHAKVGDEITARTATPLEIAGLKFPVGAIVTGRVTKADQNLLVLAFDQVAVKKDPPFGWAFPYARS